MVRKRKASSTRPVSGPRPILSLDDIPDPTIEGDYPDINRISTGIFSLDRALGNGLPLRTAVEIFGYNGAGKSTFSYYLGGLIASKQQGFMDVADFETLDKTYLIRSSKVAGFSGKIRLVPITEQKGKEARPANAEGMLTTLLRRFAEESSAVAIVDSVSAIVPESEQDESKEIGEGRLGMRAKIMAEFMRDSSDLLRRKEKAGNVLVLNHPFANIGSRGSSTAGGETIKNLSQIRIRLQPQSHEEDRSIIVQGYVEKLRFTPIDYDAKTFKFVIKGGFGVHLGLSAVQDCISYGLAQESRTINIGGKSMGYWKNLLADYNDRDKFKPFIEALEKSG